MRAAAQFAVGFLTCPGLIAWIALSIGVGCWFSPKVDVSAPWIVGCLFGGATMFSVVILLTRSQP